MVFSSTIAPFVTAKQAQGYTVTTYDAAAGVTNTTIKSYISGLWSGANPPDYISAGGRHRTRFPHWVGGGEGSPDTDLPYALHGRQFRLVPGYSHRTIFSTHDSGTPSYHRQDASTMRMVRWPDPTYLTSCGLHGLSRQCIDYGGNAQLRYRYTYDAPTGIRPRKLYYDDGATTQQVRDAFNAGVFYGIYSGHGGTTSWADGPPFSVSDVNGLTNTDMYPFCLQLRLRLPDPTFQLSVSPRHGFELPTRAHLLSTVSSVNSYWTEDDVLERRLFDAIFDADDSVPSEVGPVWQEALVRFVAEMGTDATSRRYHEMYNLMGDPSLRFPGACSDAGTVVLDKTKYRFGDTCCHHGKRLWP